MSLQISESVGPGHPDKIADCIADSLLQEYLRFDINSQFACEVLVSNNLVVIAGELFTSSVYKLDVNSIVFNVLRELGYGAEKFEIISKIQEQSKDIRSASIESNKGIVSGDQSIVFGGAINETKNYLPLSFEIATSLIKETELKIREGILKGGKLDIKSLVSLENKKIDKIFMSIQHEKDIDVNKFSNDIYELVIKPFLKKEYSLDIRRDQVFINRSGQFVIGGLKADTGVTNRKLLVDSYGTTFRHGGGGYSGKDFTKVDRLGAYYARWICKNIVAANLCDSLEMQISYFCGGDEPLEFFLNMTNSKFKEEEIIEGIKNIFPLKFSEIYKLFNKPHIEYKKLACYGHFGRSDLDLPWEKLDKVEKLREYFGNKN